MSTTIRYFKGSLIFSFFSLIAGAAVGYFYEPTLLATFEALLVTFALGVLEFSLSLDNAVVNAATLKNMNEKWRRRFLTWGILIAVFGMRLIFPLVVVSATTGINPWAALVLAATQPHEYARIMESVHISLAGFGASFLMLVAVRYFFDHSKEVHWFGWIEKPLAKMAAKAPVDILFCLIVLLVYSRYLPAEESLPFLFASGCGIGLYLLIHAMVKYLHIPSNATASLERASVMMFLYLEVLDASFSLDGVIGAFAITHNLFIMAIGLGIGAMFVRSLTLMLVDKRALDDFIYLEHGAFYAVGVLATIMLVDVFIHVPDMFIGLIGIAIIGLSLVSSVRHRRQPQGG